MESDELISQNSLNYRRIAQAIKYINNHFREQPGLDEIAKSVQLSQFHFQRMFTEWAGISPKQFLKYISTEHAKKILKENSGTTLFDAAYQTGLSGTGRLHDLFITVEGMTPAEYKNGGKNLAINYSFADTPFGKIIAASTLKGICYLSFEDDSKQALDNLKEKFPGASYQQIQDEHQQNALFIFQNDWSRLQEIKLHLKGTDFQLRVWETLLKIPPGKLADYGKIAESTGNRNAARAVGSAIGKNPVAYLIPCHRVIKSTGKIGGYMWGETRKIAMIGREGALTDKMS